LPFSKALVSIAFVGLILISTFSFLKNRKFQLDNSLFFLPIFLFISLGISLFYSSDLRKGLDVLLSQIEFLVLPFIFLVNQSIIKERFLGYIKLLIGATTIAAFITFIFFLLPTEVSQSIATTIPFLKDYVVHEKELAFGVYSPFTERLQFSYIIGAAIFLQFWLLFNHFRIEENVKPSSLHLPPEGEKNSSIKGHTTQNEVLLEKENYLLSLIKISILFSTLLILGARGAQLSFLVASIVWMIGGYFYFILPKFSIKVNALFAYIFLFFGLTFLLVIAPFLAYQKIPAVKMRYDQMRWEIGTFQDGTYTHYEYIHFTSIRRLLSWRNSWAIIQENPILGVGIGDYQAAMEKEYVKDNLGFPANTQSQFLYYWTAAGLISLFSFLGLLFFFGITFIRQQDFDLNLLGLSFLIFYILIFLFDAPLNFQVGAMTFLTVFCLLLIKLARKPHQLIPS